MDTYISEAFWKRGQRDVGQSNCCEWLQTNGKGGETKIEFVLASRTRELINQLIQIWIGKINEKQTRLEQLVSKHPKPADFCEKRSSAWEACVVQFVSYLLWQQLNDCNSHRESAFFLSVDVQKTPKSVRWNSKLSSSSPFFNRLFDSIQFDPIDSKWMRSNLILIKLDFRSFLNKRSLARQWTTTQLSRQLVVFI